MEPIVDINIAVYNQAPYLRQTLDSVLAQKTIFPFRLLIGDDCSTDGSIEILKEYEKNHPGKFKVIYQPKNIGLNSPDRNGIILLRNSTAKYIALLDGDDFWTDLYKLQRQIDFLESNPNYVGCFHNTEERYEDGIKASYLYCNYPTARNISFIELSYKNIIPTCSVVYRNKLFNDLPDWYYSLKMGDWPLHLLNATFGDFWYIPNIMGVHRLHYQSSWMLQDAQKNNQYVVDAYDIMIKGFAANSTLQSQLITARKAFTTPQKISLARRGINFVRKIKNRN